MRINLLHNFPRWMLTCMFALSPMMAIAMESPDPLNSALKPKVLDLAKLGLRMDGMETEWAPGEGRFAVKLSTDDSKVEDKIAIIRSNDLTLIDLIDVPNGDKTKIKGMSFNPNNSNELFYTHSNDNGIQEFCIRDSSTKKTRSQKVVDAPHFEEIHESLWSKDGSNIFVKTRDDKTGYYSTRVVSSQKFEAIPYSSLLEQAYASFDARKSYENVDWYDSDDENSAFRQSPRSFEKEGRVNDVVPTPHDPTRIVMTTCKSGTNLDVKRYIVIQRQGPDGSKEITSCGDFNSPIGSILKLSPHGTYALDFIFCDAIVCYKTELIRRAALAGAPNTAHYTSKPNSDTNNNN